MDDPWGSPWTSNNDDFGSFASAPMQSGAVTPGPKPPRPALLAKISSQDLASTNSIPRPPTLSFSSLEPSPWADDDNFGDWAAADSGSLGWGSSLPSFIAANDDNKLSPRPKDRSVQPSPQLNPVQWPASMTPIARPPGALTPRSRASSTMSRASDPWGQREKVDTVDNADKVDDTFTVETTKAEAANAAIEDTGYDTEEEAESRTESHVDADHDHRDDHPETDDGHDLQQQVSPTTSVEDGDDDSGEDDDGDDGNDEDTENDLQLEHSQDKSEGPNYPALRRKPSSKVQGLVELFDGLAKRPISASGSLSGSTSGSKAESKSGSRSASATRSMERRPSRQLSIKDLPEDGADEEVVGEHTIEPVPETAEEAVETAKTVGALPEPKEPSQVEAPQITVEPIEEAIEEPSATQLDISSKEAAPAQSEAETRDSKGGKDGKEEAKDTNNTSITPADALLALYGKQEPYVVDTAKVDALFPILPKPRADNGEDDVNAFIPDGYILDDSFTNISERRVWYRIARHGSSRKHNAGGSEDDNYRPVTWATSTVLPETVKIVRRWMEEDSFTGKSTLGAGLYSGGGGARGSNMFGWDSAAEPVTLDQVFKRASIHSSSSSAKKEEAAKPKIQGHAHARTLSNTDTHPAESSAAAAAASAFGWGSDAPVSKAKETVRHSVHFGGFPSLASFGSEGGDNVWATPAAAEKWADKPASPIRQSFGSMQTQTQTQNQNQTQNGDQSRRGHKSTPSIGSLPPPPKLVPRPSPLSINTVVSKPSADVAGAKDGDENKEDDVDDDDDDDDEWGEMVMSPTSGASSLPPPMLSIPATASLQEVPVLAPPAPAPTPLVASFPASFSAPAAAPPKTVSFQEPSSGTLPESSKSTSHDTFIESIINGLPDLSYMAV